tara:strand:+ start:603 stop:809 length:207 start_codon:yes stop_codon:yes gene_type:complete
MIIIKDIKLAEGKDIIAKINWELITSKIKFVQYSDFRKIKNDTFLCTWEVENLAIESEAIAIIDKHYE